MAWSTSIPYSGSDSVYLKPVTPGSAPSSSPTWANDAVDAGSSSNGASLFSSLTDGQEYWAFEQVGASKASDDPVLYFGVSDKLTVTHAEVQKIPRAAATITAGGNITRTKQSASSTVLVETLS